MIIDSKLFLISVLFLVFSAIVFVGAGGTKEFSKQRIECSLSVLWDIYQHGSYDPERQPTKECVDYQVRVIRFVVIASFYRLFLSLQINYK